MSSRDPYQKPYVSPYHNHPYPIPPLPEGFVVEHVTADLTAGLVNRDATAPPHTAAEEPCAEVSVEGLMLAFNQAAAGAHDRTQAAGYVALEYLRQTPTHAWTEIMDALLEWVEEEL